MKNKKRVFICIHYLEIGGAERSLIGLLNAVNLVKYDIDLFVYHHIGELMSHIPKGIHLLEENKKYASIEIPLVQVLKQGYFDIFCARLWAKFEYKWFIKKRKFLDGASIFQYVADNVTPFLPSLNNYGVYDLAISFLTPHNIVLDKVKAKKKISWIHTDYSTIEVNTIQELKIWRQYDFIASISEDVTTAFLKKFPSLKAKIVQIENILSSKFVREQSLLNVLTSEMHVDEGVIKLCSVGRFCAAKNFDNVPYICKKIIERGLNIKWFIIGFGGDERLINERIKETRMEQHVILLGKKTNPYPYIKACDIYLQPSRYEGKAITVREAQILCKPVIITNFPTAKSQLQDGIDGLIVPLDNELAAKHISNFIKNKSLQQKFIDYMKVHDYGNENEVEKIYNLI